MVYRHLFGLDYHCQHNNPALSEIGWNRAKNNFGHVTKGGDKVGNVTFHATNKCCTNFELFFLHLHAMQMEIVGNENKAHNSIWNTKDLPAFARMKRVGKLDGIIFLLVEEIETVAVSTFW